MILLEKVSKQEFEEALKNPRIRLGCEFEFMVPSFIEANDERIKSTESKQELEGELAQYDEDLNTWAESGEVGPPPKVPQMIKDLDPSLEDGDEIEAEDFEEFFAGAKQDKDALFKSLVKNDLKMDEFMPSSQYWVTTNEKGKKADKWVVKPDGSLGIGGVEVVTPVMTLVEFLDIVPKFFNHIEKYGDTNDYCGFHIGISIDGIGDLTKVLDVIKMALFTDEGYIYKAFKEREYNKYAKSVHSAIKSGEIVGSALEQVIDIGKVQKEYSNDHMMAINIEHLTNYGKNKNKYIEFRYLGAGKYHQKWSEIRRILAMYSYTLSMACDPEWRKAEYIQRLNRVINKVELFTNLYNYVIMSNSTGRSEKEIADLLRLDINNKDKLLKQIKVVAKVVNLSPQDIKDMLENDANMNKATEDEIMKLYKEIR